MRNPWLWGSALAVVVVLAIAYATGWIGGGVTSPPAAPTVEQSQ